MNSLIEKTRYFTVWEKHTRCKETSKTSIRSCLRVFSEYLELRGMDILDFDPDHFYLDPDTGDTFPMDQQFVLEYFDWLLKKYSRRYTAITHFSNVKHLFHVLHKAEAIQINAFETIRLFVGPRGIRTTTLNSTEIQSLLLTAKNNEPCTGQYVVAVSLMVLAGMRNSEVRHLRWENIDFGRSQIHIVEGFKIRPRTIDVGPKVLSALNSYKSHTTATGYLYPGANGPSKPISMATLILIVRRLVRQAGIKKAVTPHVLRHTCATRMYQKGIDPRVIMDYLGQQRESTTFGYIHLSTEEKRQVLVSSTVAKVFDLVFNV